MTDIDQDEFDPIDDLFKHPVPLHLLNPTPLRRSTTKAAQKQTTTPKRGTTAAPKKAKSAHTLPTIMHKTFQPIVPMIEDFLPEESVNILHGHPGSGKSFLVGQIVKCRADGTEFLGQYPVVQGRVLHMALEYPEREYQHRMQKLGIQNWQNVDYYTEEDLPLSLDDIEAWCHDNPGELVIIDMYKNIAKKRSKHWTIEDHFHALYDPLKLMVPAHHVTIIAVAHSNDLGRLYGGPSASGRIDNVYLLTKDGKQPKLTTATLTAFKARTAVPATYTLQFNETVKNWDLISDKPEQIPESELTPALQAIYDVVARHNGMSMRDISSQFPEKTHNTIRVQVKLLLDDNFLERKGTLYYAVFVDADGNRLVR